MSKLGAFYNNLLKIHPNNVIWAPSSLTKNPPIAISNLVKKHLNIRHKAGTYTYHVNVRISPLHVNAFPYIYVE